MVEHKYAEAENLCKKMQGPFTQSFQPLGELQLTFADTAQATHYYRDLDLAKSLSHVRYSVNGVKCRREIFVSNPDKVMVIKLSADKKGSISFTASLKSQVMFKIRSDNQILKMRCKAPKHVEPSYRNFPIDKAVLYDNWGGEGMEAEVWLSVENKGGKIFFENDQVRVTGADEVVLLLTAATSYNGRFKSPGIYQPIATGASGFTIKQYSSLGALCADIEKRYGRKMIYVGHQDIAGTRAVDLGLRKDAKTDPGNKFDWKKFKRRLALIKGKR